MCEFPLEGPVLGERIGKDGFVLARKSFAEIGDPWAGMDKTAFSLEPLLDLWKTLPGGELNFPPDYPKMPGEPPRVQPSPPIFILGYSMPAP